MNNFEIVIGIEAHVVLNTKTKIFSSAANTHDALPNEKVAYIDLGLPGLLPIINKEVVKKAIILADTLNMKIHHDPIIFDRKNYFYPDLPKGYQITQQFHPIGTDGIIEITDENNQLKNIRIERIHMEEDTAKQMAVEQKMLLDLNRAGAPLIEIVTTPCMNSAFEAMAYLDELRKILIFKNISDARMEKGSLRADVNVSVRLRGQKELGTRTEIKNINSISNVGKAIEFEAKRQIHLLLNGELVKQETRRFDDVKFTTEFLREKSNAVDYRYMTDPNVFQFSLSKKYVEEILDDKKPSPKQIQTDLQACGLAKDSVDLLLNNIDLCLFYLQIAKKFGKEYILIYNWIVVELIGCLNHYDLKLTELPAKQIENFVNLINLLINQDINTKQAKILLDTFINKYTKLEDLIKKLGFVQIKDPKVILPIIKKYMAANQDLVKQYSERPERVEKFLTGMVMKDTNSQANPVVTTDLVRQLLNK